MREIVNAPLHESRSAVITDSTNAQHSGSRRRGRDSCGRRNPVRLTVTRRTAVAVALSAVSALALQGLALPSAHASTPRTAALGSRQVDLGTLTARASAPAALNSAVSTADRRIATAKV